jgi:hypothetical protein
MRRFDFLIARAFPGHQVEWDNIPKVPREISMVAYRLAKDNSSVTSGGCPALYSTDDPKEMRAQGKVLTDEELAELLELLDDETAVRIPAETLLRGVARYVSDHGDDDLSGRIEAFVLASEL